jgi:asparagine synthase (glutamine-hydrolysing)
MCGIAGAINCGDAQVVGRMTEALRHRGPDDRGVVFFPHERLGLGHRRLSIIDLSPAGHQPMSTEDENLWITFNGEIYNFIELRDELRSKGHEFRSSSDTEVILHLYQEYGPAFVARLNGIFAFAIFDKVAGKVLFARDHLGVKPLYYYHSQGRLLFGSEIKAILESGSYSKEVNWQAIDDYFTFACVPCPHTAFRGIMQVPPAHTMTFDLRSGQLKLEKFWDIGAAVKEAAALGDGRARLRSLLADSVRRQMISDVPLGIFLSGGLDSPILVGLAAQASTTPIKTFTVVFEGKHLEFFDERKAAREVAQRFGTDHREIPASINDPFEMLRVVTSFDQPFANPTAYLMYLISSHTRSQATVALCGAGGDELFAGYPRYRAMQMARMFRYVPQPAIKAARKVLGFFTDDYRKANLRRAREFLDGLDSDFTRQFTNWTYYLDEDEKRSLLRGAAGAPELKPASRIVRDLLADENFPDFGNRVLAADVQTFLLDNLLEYTDKMSMAVGLEVRVPYLDPRVVATALAIPFADKIGRGRGKKVLREVFSDLLPPVVQSAPKKGFVAPLGIWLKETLDSYFDRHMSRARTDGQNIFNWGYIQQLRRAHRGGAGDYSTELFSIMMFDTWYRHYILDEDLLSVSAAVAASA